MARCHIAQVAGAAFLAMIGSAQAQETLKIAAIENLTGPSSPVNRLYALGTKFGVEMLNAEGGWKGQKVEYLEYDNQNSTSITAEKVRAAIADGVHIIVEGGSSAIAGQITEDVRKHNLRNPNKRVIFLNPGAEALELTGDKCHFYHFRFTTNADMRVRALVAAMKKTGDLGEKVFSIGQNYSWGKDVEAAVVGLGSANGYTVVDKVLHDTNKIQDFSPFAARMASSGATSAITGNWGNDLALLLKAVSAAGVKVTFGTTFLDLPGALTASGDAALGYYHADVFNAEAFGKEADEMFEAYKSKTGTYPSTSEVKTIYVFRMLQQALAKLPPGDKIDTTAIAKALESSTLKVATGEMKIRPEDHQLITPIVVSRVVKDPKYPYDGTTMGFRPVGVISGEDTINPVQASCKMQRPD